MAGHFVFRYAGTDADFCFVAEDNYKCSIAFGRDDNYRVELLLLKCGLSSPALHRIPMLAVRCLFFMSSWFNMSKIFLFGKILKP